jgi:hypothetical protein
MADLTPEERADHLGQLCWALTAAAMDTDHDAVACLVDDLTPADAKDLIRTLAGVLGYGLATAYGEQKARALVTEYALYFAATAGE